MIKNLFRIALRNLWKQKFYSLINILGFSAGLTTVILILLYVTHELSYDTFNVNAPHLARVVENQYYTGQPVFPVAVTPFPLGPSLKTEYPEIINAVRVVRTSNLFEKDDEKFAESGAYVDPEFMEMFTYPLIQGELETALAGMESILISQKLAEKYFGSENVVGKSIVMSGQEKNITGILKNFPDNSHLDFDYLLPFDAAGYSSARLENWRSNSIYTYVQLSDKSSMDQVSEKINGHIKKYNESSITEIYLQPITDIHLGTVQFVVDVDKRGNRQYVEMFLLIAIFVLIIACINFMNLSTAKSIGRAKEVGLRKTLGAIRRHLIMQFMGESLFMTLLAMIIAIFLADLLLPFFNTLAGTDLNLQSLNSSTGVSLIGWACALTIVTGLVSGTYPSFFLSRFHPAYVLKGSFKGKKEGASLRKTLVILQFGVSILLIIGTLVVNHQLQFMRTMKLGINKDNVLYIWQVSENKDYFESEVKKIPGVMGIGFANQHPAYVESSSSGISWQGANPDDDILFHFESVDEGYIETMGLEILEGRGFNNSLPGDTAAVIINEEAAQVIGFEEPVGQVINGGREYQIIGVVRDFHFKSVHVKIEPLILVYRPESFSRTFIKVKGEGVTATVKGIEEIWNKLNPGKTLEYHFLEEDYDALYRSEERTSKIFSCFTVLAFIISGLGLFGLSSFAAEQRTKEISIRKVMGASPGGLFWLVSKDLSSLILISIVIAVPLGWIWMNSWLQDFPYRINLTVWVFVIASISGLIITFLTVSFQSFKVARSNPVQHLRNE